MYPTCRTRARRKRCRISPAARSTFVFFGSLLGMGLFNGGQLKVLAVTDKARLPLLPNVPTMAEAGYKDVEIVTLAAVFAPAKTDPAIVDRLNKEINKVLATQQAKDYIHKMGATPFVTTPAELRVSCPRRSRAGASSFRLAGIPKK